MSKIGIYSFINEREDILFVNILSQFTKRIHLLVTRSIIIQMRM